MTRGVLGLNTRTIGVSRDEVISAVREIDCAVSLVMDDPELVAELSTMGVQVVYRQHDDQRLDIDPAQFVAERAKNAPSAGYIALTNEVVSSPQLHAWTRKALEAATAQGVKAVAYSYGTNAPASHFQDAYDNLVYMRQHGHALGVHLYPDGKPDHEATLKEFLTLKHALGLTVICTEFGYLRDFGNGTEGWRGLWNADQRAAFLEAWMPFFDAEQIPVCQFCFDPWDQPTVEKAKSDGLGFWDYPDVLQTMAALNARYPFKGMPTMPVTVPINPGAPVQAAATTALKLRSNAGTRYPQVGSIAAHENVTCYPASEVVNVYPWVFVERADGQRGWAARADTDGTAWIVPVPPPVTWTVRLDAPYVSQLGTTAAQSNNDCGIASLLILERYAIAMQTGIVPDVPTVDDLTQYTPLNGTPALKGLSFAQIGDLAKRTGFKLEYVTHISADAFTGFLRDGKPVMVLLDYSVYAPGKAQIAHILVVSGYNATEYLTQDPYQLGANVRVPQDRLLRAMASSPGNSLGFQGAVLA